MHSNALDATNSPLTVEQAGAVNRLIEALSADQRTWLSGYLTGVNAAASAQPAPSQAPAAHPLTILYGSETGNAEGVARQLGEQALARGLDARVVDLADYKHKELRQEARLVIVTATHGEGEPPDPAADFYEFLHGRKAPKLKECLFAVLGLGDSSYEFFCQTGQDFDRRLEALGAERLSPRLDCDVDYEEPAQAWITQLLDALASRSDTPAPGAEPAALTPQDSPQATRYDRQHPFLAEVLECQGLNGRGSPKETYHLELSLEGAGLDYQPGDILCLLPRNREAEVSALLDALGLDPEERVESHSGGRSLFEALRDDYEITTLTPPVVEAYAARIEAPAIGELLAKERRGELMDYLYGRHLIDLVLEYPGANLDAPALLGMLRKLQPREYSIASSHLANPEEVHLTVAAVRYTSFERERHGVASTYLCDLIEPGDRVPIYLRTNKHFRLPDNPETPLIMVGPGTGVAPFRAFLQQREELGASGPSWLFFGNPHFRTDFLYQTEFQDWLKRGVLSRLDVAFSRDEAEKIYVQQRLRERGGEVYRWLEDGAHFYVCGDAERMAPDVNDALIEIVREHGGHSKEAATDYVKQLQRDKRYQRDVY
ncbi:assimilatory sulfite reductase (NADPH) flavoprotein subunit [Pistricoccus aurantiacus]|uniref:Sulfite reductase [NADPH] flavoprotein alpha-component n=1 Tax=Pistricoccus aurantiacus TaxID=1883414 RepID=A0A5B8SQ60_9GAMM|nr:assimilatory sulfite reductase (NADPH) flavoprotein subunit [Pistricoccus aurantiacus]QEA38157.1 assimilatory sulfite reductase (NADPH) flavoprotein subunit [Pistricoccus aurantiacus]